MAMRCCVLVTADDRLTDINYANSNDAINWGKVINYIAETRTLYWFPKLSQTLLHILIQGMTSNQTNIKSNKEVQFCERVICTREMQRLHHSRIHLDRNHLARMKIKTIN